MSPTATELELPLGDAQVDGFVIDRLGHLTTVAGVDEAAAARLARSFPSLAAIYAAPESRLRAVVGPVAAARIRWFLDAPLRSTAVIPHVVPSRAA
jgi:hypothetical protein